MKLIEWNKLPGNFQNNEVKQYYDELLAKKNQLIAKRIIDIIGSVVGIILLAPVMIIIALFIKFESKGPVIFKQVRVTQYGKKFKIYKFRTMVVDAEKIGTQVTSKNDSRITKIGKKIRKYRLDELPQIFNIIKGELSFVGTRPEVPKYVDNYANEMMATLLLPAGVTSRASIQFKDEEKMLDGSNNIDKTYIEEVLPLKMKYNLEYITNFTALDDIIIMFETVKAIL